MYRTMRFVKAGDVILHLTDNRAFTGISIVQSSFHELQLGFEAWYRVPLVGYRKLIPPLDRTCFFSSGFGTKLLKYLNGSVRANVFYERRLRLRQGAYLTPLSVKVLGVLDEAYMSISDVSLIDLIRQARESLVIA
jgi:hypothetical protein